MYIDKNSKVIIQGITGNQGRFHTRLMLDYGTNIVAGSSPGKRGQESIPYPQHGPRLDYGRTGQLLPSAGQLRRRQEEKQRKPS